jgi:hypothetical protein
MRDRRGLRILSTAECLPWAPGADDAYVRITSSVISGRELTHEVVDSESLASQIGA